MRCYSKNRAAAFVAILAVSCVQHRLCEAVTTIISDGADLVAVVASAADNDVIEIRSNDTFVGTLTWINKFLTIRAGDGFHPTIKGTPYTATNPVGSPAVSGVVGAFGTGGSFTGLRFEPGQHADVLPPPYSNFGPNDFNVVSVGSTGTKWSNLTFQQNEFAGSVRIGETGSVTFDTAFRENHFLSSLQLGATGSVQMNAVLEKNKIDKTLVVNPGSRTSVLINENDLNRVLLNADSTARLEATITNNFIRPTATASSFEGGINVSINGIGQVYVANNVIAGAPGNGNSGIAAYSNLSPSYSGRFVNNTIVGFANGILDRSYIPSSYENMLLWNRDDIYTFFGSSVSASTMIGSLISDGTFAGINGNFGGVPTLGPIFELLAGSIGIDAGNHALDLPAFDIAGNARIFDGNSDGIARVDVGAFEYFNTVPEPSALLFVSIGIAGIASRLRRKF